ncbi:MAG: carboxylesterase family protein, partial [Kordiimonadaceae bacterium]|nr:carboxylesterase family protein [Kordiimonadaceae bacterium]
FTSIIFTFLLSLTSAFSQIVELEQGKIKGSTENTIHSFKGIPYAAPPIGPLRWHAPQAIARHDGQFDASNFGPLCLQPVRPDRPAPDMSEDCLTLNVWTPAIDSGKRPVMLFIHGGGFRTGSGNIPGEVFAKKGAVVVSIKYRLGALGFFAHDALVDLPANPGLLDAIHALKWVKSNIASFGGDPDNVTIFGYSAGGMMVNLLASNDKAEGLFGRAIAQSGYAAWPLLRSNKAPNTAPLNAINAENHARNLIAKLTSEPQTSELLYQLDGTELANTVTTFHVPIVDGNSIEEEPGIRFIRGEQLDIAYMSGGNSFDGSSMGGLGPTGPSEYEQELGNDLTEARALYKDDTQSDWLMRMWGDKRYVLSARLLADNMKNKQSNAWLYYTDFVEEEEKSTSPGTSHGKGSAFLFRVTDKDSTAMKALANEMQQYYFNFASTGNPNGVGLPEWPTYNGKSDNWMVFGDDREAKSGVITEKLDFAEKLYLKRVAPALDQ